MYAGADLFDLRYDEDHFRRLQRSLQFGVRSSVDRHAFHLLAQHFVPGWLGHHFVARRLHTVHSHVDHCRHTLVRLWTEPSDGESDVRASSSVRHQHYYGARRALSSHTFKPVPTATTTTTTTSTTSTFHGSTYVESSTSVFDRNGL